MRKREPGAAATLAQRRINAVIPANSRRRRNCIKLARPTPETMRNAAAFDCAATVRPSMTRCQRLALKGPHGIAQGSALGRVAKHRMSPERAKYGPRQWADLVGRKSSLAIPPFQGGNLVGFGFPGLRLWAPQSFALGSHSAPSGPAFECMLNLITLGESRDPYRGTR